MEVATRHRTVPVVESSQPSAARLLTRDIAETAGFGEEDSYRAGIVASELATNLVKHARGGEFLVRVTAGQPNGEIELISIDRGPGIRDLAASMADGHSTAGSPGNGLGAVRRLADFFDAFSTPEHGTVLVTRLRARRRKAEPSSALIVGAISTPMTGEQVCGDAWDVRTTADGLRIVVADGLGHGIQAAEAADAAVSAFEARSYVNNVDALQAIHHAIRHTRGAAAAIAEIRPRDRTLKYVGVGNISTVVWHPGGTSRQAVSHNGTLGYEARLFREYSYPLGETALVVMHSDGVSAHWSLEAYPGLIRRHPAVIAAVLHRDFNRGRDDATVLVAKEAKEAA
jgi:anti-sigma regulatory factor (Ser/Thr protein kinase)